MHFDYFFSYFCLGALTILILALVNGGSAVYNRSYIQTPCDTSGNRELTLGANGYQKYGIIAANKEACYKPNSTCHLKLSASGIYHISVTFHFIAIETSDVLIIKDEAQTHLLNGNITPTYPIYSNSNWMKLEFITNADINKCLSGFRLDYITFRHGQCYDDEFRCSLDGRCIPKEAVCDTVNNCGDWSDEESGGLSCDGTSTGVILKAGYHLLSISGVACIFSAYGSWQIRRP